MEQSKFGSQDMTWMTVSNFSGNKIEIHGVPQGVQYLVRLYHENHKLFLWETDLHTCRWCLCLHLTMGLEWHQLFSLVPATNKSNAMIDLTPNTLHCDSWWHSGYRNENNHTRSNPLFLKHHFGHFLRWYDTWRHQKNDFSRSTPRNAANKLLGRFSLPRQRANVQHLKQILNETVGFRRFFMGQNSGTRTGTVVNTKVAGIYGCSSPQTLVS